MRVFIVIIASVLTSFQLHAQCGTPSMSIWENTWTSCLTSPNPNPDRGSGHWIQYEFSEVQRLTKAHIWNTNESGQSQNGFKNVVVDYSTDGTEWKELGSFEFSKGTEEAVYGGFEGFDFQKDSAKYVVITASSNWGGECYGLAEVKFNLWSEAEACEEEPCDVENSACPTPTGLTIYQEDETEVAITWDEVEGAEVYIVLLIFPGGELEYEVEEPELYVSDLTENTEYEVIVFAECEEDRSEEAFLSFTTDFTTSLDKPNAEKLSEVSLVPNPASARVSLLFDSHVNSMGIIQVFDLCGAELKNYPMQITAGKNNFAINTDNLPSGIYYISLSVPTEKFSMTQKLIVL